MRRVFESGRAVLPWMVQNHLAFGTGRFVSILAQSLPEHNVIRNHLFDTTPTVRR